MDRALQIRVLGPVRVLRGGVELALPPSRKVRALLALLVLDPGPISRSRLCDLLWDVPNDPRGELRWCLSKLRGLLDDGERRRVRTTAGSGVSLDLSDCLVDAVELARVAAEGVATVRLERLLEVESLVAGDLLEGAELEGPELTAWLASQRKRHRTMHVALLRELSTRATPLGNEHFRWLERWLRQAPFELEAHTRMIDALVRSGAGHDAEAHLTATIRAFEQEGLDWAPLRAAFQGARRVSVAALPEPPVREKPPEASAPRHGSVVVMPFAAAHDDASRASDGLTDDIITRLAKLRALFVIARGTSYALRDRGLTAHEMGRVLEVAYVVSGVVRRHGERMVVHVELVRTKDAGIVWTETLESASDQPLGVLDSIVDRIVASIAEEIERAECARSLLKPPSSLDAWESYHRGLFHVYRFNGPDNQLGARFFEDALGRDPGFARAHAGLSFAHFQNVFLGLTDDRERQLGLAFESAQRSLACDERDPAAHWAMGRALWLRGERGASLAELERCVELSPNFALGHYTLGFVHAQSGEPRVAIEAVDRSRLLSPFDPLQFGMLGARALAHMRLGEHEAAAEWAVRAVSRPHAHVHILAIAAANLALARRTEEARELVARIRGAQASYRVQDLLRAFDFAQDAERVLRQGAKRIGFD